MSFVGRVRVLSERVMIPGKEPLVRSVMEKVVARVRLQPGFVRGDTLQDVHQPELFCVLTEWDSGAYLNRWFQDPDFKHLTLELDSLLGKPTRYQIFQRNKEEVFLL